MHLLDKVKITRLSNAVAVGTTTITGAVGGNGLDMTGFDGVLFMAIFGAITDGTPDLKARQGQALNMSDAADLANTLLSALDTDDNKVLLLDVFRPLERYVDCQVVRGGATGSVLDGIFALQYNTRDIPVTQPTGTVSGSEKHVSPAEGTA